MKETLTMNDLNIILEDYAVLAETSECNVSCIVIVRHEDAQAARDVMHQAMNIWFNYLESDERFDLLDDQIINGLESAGINFIMPEFEEIAFVAREKTCVVYEPV